MMTPKTIRHAARRAAVPGWLPISAGAAALCWLIAAPAGDVADGTLAAAIRGSGHPCAKIVEKQHAGEASAVWQVRCNSGRFQLTEKDDATFEVTALD